MPISFTAAGVSVPIAEIANHRMALVAIPPLDTDRLAAAGTAA